LMSPNWIADDDHLFEALRECLVTAGRVPAEVVTAAKEVFSLRNMDEELARLTYDSRADADLVGAFRSETLSVRSLVFGFGDVTLDIDVLSDAVVGQVAPAQAGVVVIETRERTAGQASIESSGMFSIPIRPRGEVRFRFESDEHSFVTEWTRL
jgi:hypothetical protein